MLVVVVVSYMNTRLIKGTKKKKDLLNVVPRKENRIRALNMVVDGSDEVVGFRHEIRIEW